MKTTITKSLRWMFLLMLLMGGVGTSMYASGGPMPTPTYPPIQGSFGAAFYEGPGAAPLPSDWPFVGAFFEGPGPMPTPQYPPFSVSSR
jgi:hypothetical protein